MKILRLFKIISFCLFALITTYAVIGYFAYKADRKLIYKTLIAQYETAKTNYENEHNIFLDQLPQAETEFSKGGKAFINYSIETFEDIIVERDHKYKNAGSEIKLKICNNSTYLHIDENFIITGKTRYQKYLNDFELPATNFIHRKFLGSPPLKPSECNYEDIQIRKYVNPEYIGKDDGLAAISTITTLDFFNEFYHPPIDKMTLEIKTENVEFSITIKAPEKPTLPECFETYKAFSQTYPAPPFFKMFPYNDLRAKFIDPRSRKDKITEDKVEDIDWTYENNYRC